MPTMDNPKRIQVLPAPTHMPRVETGAVQFGDDWPGLFIRGDNALWLMTVIQQLKHRLADHPDNEVGDLLASLTQYARIIEQHVRT